MLTDRARGSMRRCGAAIAAFLLTLAAPGAYAAPCAGFTDVDSASSFCTNVAWMKNRSITLGCAASLYCPNAPVTRLAMAAFMNRLGDAVLPPKVTWVSATGGTYHTIQAAIDAAAAAATSTNPALVKIAPGVYNEQVTMKPYVDVEGSGVGVTTITAASCTGASPPNIGTVVLSDRAQLRKVTVVNPGGAGSFCAALVAANAGSRPLDSVAARASSAGGLLTFAAALWLTDSSGTRIDLANLALSAAQTTAASEVSAFRGETSAGSSVVLRGSRLAVSGVGGAGSWGYGAYLGGVFDLRDLAIDITGAENHFGVVAWGGTALMLTDTTINAIATSGNLQNAGVVTGGAAASIQLVRVAAKAVGPSARNAAVDMSTSAIQAEASNLEGSGGTMNLAVNANGGRIARSRLVGSIINVAPTCFNNYNGSFAAVTC